MRSVQAILTGQNVRFLDKVESSTTSRKVIVTFLEEENDLSSDEMARFAQQGGAFDFLNDEAEDVYTDDDLEVKFKK